MSTYKDYAILHLIVFVWGFTAILGMLITIPPVEIVFYRTLITTAFMGVMMWRSHRQALVLGVPFWQAFATGSIIAAHWILFFLSARVGNVSVCLAGMSTVTFWTSFIEPLILKRRVRVYEVVLGLVIMFGLYLIFRFEFDNALSLGLAVISAMLSALFSVINVKLIKKMDPYVITFYEMGGAWVSTLLFLPFLGLLFGTGPQLNPTSMDWVYLGILAIVCTVYPFAITVELMKRISAYAVNLTINLEPIYGIILALIIFGEREKMSAGFYGGTAIILSSVVMYPFLNRYFNKRSLAAKPIQ